MKLSRCILACLLMLPGVLAAQGVDTMYTRLFNASGNSIDLLTDIIVDQHGNVYMTGVGHSAESNTDDYWTVACDRWGNRLWSDYYDGASHWNDSAAALCLDSRDNLYVTGQSFESGSDSASITTIKYSGGARAWVSTIHFPGDIDDGGIDIVAMDTLTLFACGYRNRGGMDIDYVVIRYDALTGDTVWTRSYSRPGQTDEDMPTAIAVDRARSVIVTGYSYGSVADYDYCTIKYDDRGTQLWTRFYNRQISNLDDYPYALTVDAANAVIVTGTSWDDNTDYDIATVKYGAGGDTVWSARYNRSPANEDDYGYALATDGFNNVYVAGTSMDTVLDYDYVAIRYAASTGTPAWIRRVDQNGQDDECYSIALDPSGGAIVTGWTTSLNNDDDVMTVKLNGATGVPLWTNLYDSPWHNTDDGQKVVTGPGSMIIVGAQILSDSTDVDYGLIRLYEQTRDVGPTAIVAPVDTVFVGDSITPKVVIHNYGIYAETLLVRLTTSSGYRDSTQRVIDANMDDTVSFRVYTESLVGTYTVRCTTADRRDVNPLNDLANDSFVAASNSGLAEERSLVVVRPFLRVAPNPARGLVNISYAVSEPKRLSLRVFDASGRLVRNLAAGQSARVGSYSLDLRNLATGIYIVKLDSHKNMFTKKLVLEK